MTPVAPYLSPALASAVQPAYVNAHASDTTFAVNTPTPIFDWSKGSASKNAGRITANNLPKMEPVVAGSAVSSPCAKSEPVLQSWKSAGKQSACVEVLSGDLVAAKIEMLLKAARNAKSKVPQLLANESKSLNAFDFASLMQLVEERRDDWSEDGKFFVFNYASGSVGSIWLDGVEVYNSIWKNV